MPLPASDAAFLQERELHHEATEEGGLTCVVFKGYALPPGYLTESIDLLIRLQPGYPDVPPDMWWCDPPARRADGAGIPATEVMEHHLGRSWQRWSRHFSAGQWKSGVDGLESFLALIRREFEAFGLGSTA